MQCNETNRLLSRAEVESKFGITKRQLEVAAVRGTGPVMIKFGRTVRYRACDIETWIADHAVGGKP